MGRPINRPCCKPLRLLSLVNLIVSFTLLFFARNFEKGLPYIFKPGHLIFLFVNYGSLLLLIAVDVFNQFVRNPTANCPVCVILILGFLGCFASGILLYLSYELNKTLHHYRFFQVLFVLCGDAVLLCILFIIDILLIIRYR